MKIENIIAVVVVVDVVVVVAISRTTVASLISVIILKNNHLWKFLTKNPQNETIYIIMAILLIAK